MPQHTAFRSALPLLNISFPCLCFAPLLRAVPSPDLPCATSPWPSSALLFHALATPCRSLPCHSFVSPCIALALPCVAVPLRFTAVLCYAAAIPRSNLPRHGNSSHRFSIPQQFNSAQCHSKTPPCCSMPSLYCSIHSQAIAVHSYPCRSLFHDFVPEAAPGSVSPLAKALQLSVVEPFHHHGFVLVRYTDLNLHLASFRNRF